MQILQNIQNIQNIQSTTNTMKTPSIKDIIGGEKSCQPCVTMPANAFQEGVCASEAIAVALASSFAVEIP
ncbi:MAG: hypothetical protein J6T46_08005, partial [Victivallales bacterium]|nr:hypothetical protein [Victivallales bacterium]